MPTVLQNIFRTICILLLTTFWSTVTLLKLLWEWWTYKDPSGRGFFTIRNRQKPSVLVKGPWQHGFLQLSNIRMHYVEAGNTKNPLMVMLHGFPEFWYSYRFQLKYFQKDYHVVALDLRGYGETDKPTGVANYDTETLAGDVVEAIEKLGGKAILIGHDWGAALAWIVAMNRPDVIADRLIILNVPHPKAFMKVVRTKSTQLLKSWYIFLFQCPLLAELRIKANDFAFLEQIFRSSKGGLIHPENFTDEDMEAWKYTFGTPNAITPPLNYYRAGMMVAGRRHFSGEPIRPKTLIIWGAQDIALEIEGALLSVPLCRDARLEIIEGASHWVQQDVHQQVNALIEHFIIH